MSTPPSLQVSALSLGGVLEQLVRRAHAVAARTAFAVEQARRSAADTMTTEVHFELFRVINARAAEAAIHAEWAAQIATPRVPSAKIASLKSDVNELIIRRGDITRATIELDHEQIARVQAHFFKIEVGPELVRVVHRKRVDAATDVEQSQLSTQRFLRTDVQLELIRRINAKAAEAAIDAEWAAQIATPRVPSAKIASLKSDVNELIARRGGSRRASIATQAEQQTRIQHRAMVTEVGPALIRVVQRQIAAAAADLERAQRISRHVVETEVNPELLRVVNAKAAVALTDAEWAAQIATPRVPSAKIASLMSAAMHEIVA